MKIKRSVLFAIPAFLLSLQIAHAQDVPERTGVGQFFIGYSQTQESSIDLELTGVGFGFSGTVYFNPESAVRAGVRPELSFAVTQEGPGTQTEVNFTIALEIAIAASEHIEPYIYGGGGFGTYELEVSGFGSASESGGILQVGGGIRLFPSEEFFIAPDVSYMRAALDTVDYDILRVTGNVGISF